MEHLFTPCGPARAVRGRFRHRADFAQRLGLVLTHCSNEKLEGYLDARAAAGVPGTGRTAVTRSAFVIQDREDELYFGRERASRDSSGMLEGGAARSGPTYAGSAEEVAEKLAADDAVAAQAQQMALRLADELGVVGVMAMELFETTDGALVVNELAMRPHNTGHWTQDGSVTSQFEQHLRAVLDASASEVA